MWQVLIMNEWVECNVYDAIVLVDHGRTVRLN